MLISWPNFIGWLKNKIKLEVIFERIDHWAKNPTPTMVIVEVIKTINCDRSIFQIPARNINAKIVMKRLTIL